MANNTKEIHVLTDENKEFLKSKTAFVLPDSPSANLWTSAQVKRKFYEGQLVLFEWLRQYQEEVTPLIGDNIEEINSLTKLLETQGKLISLLQTDLINVKEKVDALTISNTTKRFVLNLKDTIKSTDNIANYETKLSCSSEDLKPLYEYLKYGLTKNLDFYLTSTSDNKLILNDWNVTVSQDENNTYIYGIDKRKQDKYFFDLTIPNKANTRTTLYEATLRVQQVITKQILDTAISDLKAYAEETYFKKRNIYETTVEVNNKQLNGLVIKIETNNK